MPAAEKSPSSRATRAAKPPPNRFFELRAPLPADLAKAEAEGLEPLPGLSGTLRLDLPGMPLFGQARKALMQLFQKRYGL